MTPPVRQSRGDTADISELRGVLATAMHFMRQTGRMPFVGELGAHEKRPVEQRANDYGVNIAAFASIGVQSCVWGYTNTHELWRDATGWEPGIADAIVTTSTLPR